MEGGNTWESFAKLLDGCRLLLFTNLLVLLLVGGSLQSLPWQSSAQKVHKYVAHSLQVITSRLFYLRERKALVLTKPQ